MVPRMSVSVTNDGPRADVYRTDGAFHRREQPQMAASSGGDKDFLPISLSSEDVLPVTGPSETLFSIPHLPPSQGISMYFDIAKVHRE